MVLESVMGAILGQGMAAVNGWFAIKKESASNDHNYKMAKLDGENQFNLAKHNLNSAVVENESIERQGEISAMVAAINADATLSSEVWPEFNIESGWIGYLGWIIQIGVVAMRKAIRPLVTLLYVFLSLRIAAQLDALTLQGLSEALRHILIMKVIDEIFFLTAMTVGFYFGNRPRRES